MQVLASFSFTVIGTTHMTLRRNILHNLYKVSNEQVIPNNIIVSISKYV